MEAPEKRKHAGSDVVSRGKRHKKAREETTVNEDELEEFFTIIRNIQVAVRHFKSVDGGGSKYADGCFREFRVMLESNEVQDGVKGMAENKKKDNVGLDLNAEPDPESDLC